MHSGRLIDGRTKAGQATRKGKQLSCLWLALPCVGSSSETQGEDGFPRRTPGFSEFHSTLDVDFTWNQVIKGPGGSLTARPCVGSELQAGLCYASYPLAGEHVVGR